jgi:hypothetical protein
VYGHLFPALDEELAERLHALAQVPVPAESRGSPRLG